MATTIEVRVPDIDDFKDISIIEMLVKPGDSVREEQSVVTSTDTPGASIIRFSASGEINDGVCAKAATATATMAAPRRAAAPRFGA